MTSWPLRFRRCRSPMPPLSFAAADMRKTSILSENLPRDAAAMAGAPPVGSAARGRRAASTDGIIELAINGRFLTQPTTGVQRVAGELVREIDRLVAHGEFGFRLRLLCQRGAAADALGLRATRIEEVAGPGGHFWEQLLLPRAVGDARLLCLGNTAPMSLLWRRRPVTVMIHDLSYRIYPGAYRRSYRILHGLMMPMLLDRASPVITVAKTERHMLEALDPACQGHVVVAQNGGWREAGEDRADGGGGGGGGARTGERYALYVGSLSRRKNIEGVLELAVRLWREEGLRFVIVGSAGTTLMPVALDVPEDARDAVRFVGQIEDVRSLADLYRHASCLVFPSFYEASPLPPLEAMHFGCPVVASDIPSLRERCGEAAEYCNAADVDDMVAAVRRVINDAERAGELVRRGYARQRRFSWREQARIVLDAITREERQVARGMEADAERSSRASLV